MPFITPVKLKFPDASEVAALPWGPLRIRVAPLPRAVVLPDTVHPVCCVLVAVKEIPVTFAPLTINDWEVGLKTYPGLLGVMM